MPGLSEVPRSLPEVRWSSSSFFTKFWSRFSSCVLSSNSKKFSIVIFLSTSGTRSQLDTSVLFCAKSALSRKQLDLSWILRGVDRQQDIMSIDNRILCRSILRCWCRSMVKSWCWSIVRPDPLYQLLQLCSALHTVHHLLPYIPA